MNDEYAIALAAMHQDMSRLDRIASNLANAATPGYQREVVAAQPFTAAMDRAREGAAPGAPAAPAQAAAPLRVVTDPRPGTVRMTGRALDVALEGDGYFEVMTPSGPAYTRRGDFQVDAQGRLVTAQGHPVMGTEGEIALATQTPTIDAQGRISGHDALAPAGGPAEALGRLKVVQLHDAGAQPRLGDGLIGAPASAVAEEGATARVRQGALENSNVSSMEEMVQLLQTMRHFESMQRIAQGYDDILGTAIRKLGDLT